MDRDSKLAIAGSLLWVVLATGVILGTHKQAAAAADVSGASAEEVSAEWHAYPASHDDKGTRAELFWQC